MAPDSKPIGRIGLLVEWFHRGWLPMALALVLILAEGYNNSRPGCLNREGRLKGRDFAAFYKAGVAVSSTRGESAGVYSIDRQQAIERRLAGGEATGHQTLFLNPPTALPLARILALIDYPLAYFLFSLLSLAALGGAFYLHSGGLAGLFWLITFGPALDNFLAGQTAAFVLLVHCFCVGSRAPWWCKGILFSLLLAKPQHVPFFFCWYLLQGRGSFLAGFVLGGLLLMIATIGVAPLSTFAEYGVFSQTVIAGLYALPEFKSWNLFSLSGALAHANLFFGLGMAPTLLLGGSFLAVFGIFFVSLFRKRERVSFEMVALFQVLGSGHLMLYDCLILFPVYWKQLERRDFQAPLLYFSMYLSLVSAKLVGIVFFPLVLCWLLTTMESGDPTAREAV